jgi:hypothetical protein
LFFFPENVELSADHLHSLRGSLASLVGKASRIVA